MPVCPKIAQRNGQILKLADAKWCKGKLLSFPFCGIKKALPPLSDSSEIESALS